MTRKEHPVSNEESVRVLLAQHRDEIIEVREALGQVLEPRHTDTWLLRFIIGSTAAKATTRFRRLLEWRRKYGMDEVEDQIRAGRGPRDFPFAGAAAAFFPQLTVHGETTLGEPVSYDFYGKSDVQKLMKALGNEGNLEEYCRWKVEYMRIHLEDLAQERGVFRRAVVVADLGGIGMRHVHRPFLLALRTTSKFMEEHYREQVGRVLVMNANSAFTLCWRFIRPALSAHTINKVNIVGTRDSRRALLKMVDEDQIPAALGGECGCIECLGSGDVRGPARPMAAHSEVTPVARYTPYNAARRRPGKPGLLRRTMKTVRRPLDVIRAGSLELVGAITPGPASRSTSVSSSDGAPAAVA